MSYGGHEAGGTVRADDIQVLAAREHEVQKIRTDWMLCREREKAVLREMEAEHKRSIYEEVFLREDGAIDVKTRNLRVDPAPRLLCNFTYPKVTAFICIADFGRIYCMSCFLGDREKRVYFDEGKGGKPSYFIRKLSSEGLEIMASTASRRKLYAEKLWITLVNSCTEEIFVPKEPGWFVTAKGKLLYFKKGESMLWREICSRAK